mmetsp:Transcript_97097/g.168427  ORF Transcript_97097/g.168427 Transcript_97097/m.168427 type:complete len:102 (+) Transcript_97097:238-543(+)
MAEEDPEGDAGKADEGESKEPGPCKQCCFDCLDCMYVVFITTVTAISSMWYMIKVYIVFPTKEAICGRFDKMEQTIKPYKVGTKVPYTHVPGFKYGADPHT